MSTKMTESEKRAMRDAERAAERRVRDAWSRAPRSQTSDSPAVKARDKLPPYGPRPLHPLDAALAKARAWAREDFRAKLARAETEELVELPSHISRLAPAMTMREAAARVKGTVSVRPLPVKLLRRRP